MSRSSSTCRHPDIRKFCGVRTCLSCGTAVFEDERVEAPPQTKFPLISRLDAPLDSCPNYSYRPLNFELGQEVRLVVVQPDELSAPIRCQIIHVNLEDEPEFEAISYTWADEYGNDTKSRLIYCSDGTSIQVTVNCEAALRRLRYEGYTRDLWIDAVCINQNNISERNHQVGLMGRVYSQASRVFICIQSPLADYQLAMAWLNGVEKVPDDDFMLAKSVSSLFSLRWFSRVWVIQEVALAEAAFLCINETTLWLSSVVLQRLRSFCLSKKLPIPGPLRRSFGPTEKTDLFTCLDATRDCLSNDPRDKIYAILSLLDHKLRSLIPINYSKDLEWIHITISVAVISLHKNLDIIAKIASSLDQSKPFSWILDRDFPSERRDSTHMNQLWRDCSGDSALKIGNSTPWMPVLSVGIIDSRFTTMLEGSVNLSQATAEIMPPEISSQSILPRLKVRAHLLTEILESKSFTPSIDCTRFCQALLFRTGLHLACGWILHFFRKKQYLACGPWVKESFEEYYPLYDLKQMLKPDNEERLDRNSRRIRSKLEELCIWDLGDLVTFLEDGMRWGKGTCIFEAEHSVGFTRACYQEGDQIFAIDGALNPFILRRIGENQYRIVGDCYLWAALELDYWNPGTYKGRWGNVSDEYSREEQTRMIELL